MFLAACRLTTPETSAMATDEPAPVLTLKERIAALQLAQASDNATPKGRSPALKPSPSPGQRRPSNTATPAGLTSPPVCRSPNDYSPAQKNAAPIPPPVNREGRRSGPPSLPPRRQTQPLAADRPPALPPRRPTDLSINRKPSSDSISSVMSGRSSVSTVSARTSFSAASEANSAASPRFRVKAPEYDPAKLPALPERRAKVQHDSSERRDFSASNAAPRPDQAFMQPPPSLPNRRQAPAAYQAQPASQHGLYNDTAPPPIPSNRPQQPMAPPNPPQPGASPGQSVSVIELDANTFDEIILRSGKPAFVDFYAPFCKCRPPRSSLLPGMILTRRQTAKNWTPCMKSLPLNTNTRTSRSQR